MSTLSTGRAIAAAGGIALLIVMFLPWFGLGGEAAEAVEQAQQVAEQFGTPQVALDTEANAFEAFEIVDLVLLGAALVAIGLAVAAMTGGSRLPPATSRIATGLAAVGTLLVLYRLIDPPDAFPAVPGFEVEVSRKIGAFLGLLATGAVAAGGWLAMQEEDAAPARRERSADRGATPPPPPPGQ